MRIRMLLVVMLTMVAMVNAFAGDKTDLSGKWVFSVEKCTLDEMGTDFLPTLTVTQKKNEFTVEKVFQREYEDDIIIRETVTLDGKENKSEFWNSPRTTTATWSAPKDTLTVNSIIEFQGGGQSSEKIINEAWSF